MRPKTAKAQSEANHVLGHPEIGAYLRDLRKKHKRTAAYVAERVGTSRAYIGLVETGDRHPSLDLLRKLSIVYDVEDSVLMGLAGYTEPWEEILPFAQIKKFFAIALADEAIADLRCTPLFWATADVVVMAYLLELYMCATGRQLLAPLERERVCSWLPVTQWNSTDWQTATASEEELKTKWATIENRHYDKNVPAKVSFARSMVASFQTELVPHLIFNRWKPTAWEFSTVRPAVPPSATPPPMLYDDSFIKTDDDFSSEK